MDFWLCTDVVKPPENKSRPKKLWDDQRDLNSDQIFNDAKELLWIFKCVWWAE